MRKSLFVLAATLICPAVASANWLWCAIPTEPLLAVQLDGQYVRAGAWNTKFYTGQAPSSIPSTAPAGWSYSAVTYCSSPHETNTNPDAYDINGPSSFNTGFMSTLLKNRLSYLVNASESALASMFGATVLEVRGAVQAAVWKILGSNITESVLGFYNNATMFNTYMALKNGAMAITNGTTPMYLTTDKFAEGLGPVGQNQNMIWTINGPNSGSEPIFPVPLPATVYGALSLAVMALAGRRLFGIAA